VAATYTSKIVVVGPCHTATHTHTLTQPAKLLSFFMCCKVQKGWNGENCGKWWKTGAMACGKCVSRGGCLKLGGGGHIEGRGDIPFIINRRVLRGLTFRSYFASFLARDVSGRFPIGPQIDGTQYSAFHKCLFARRGSFSCADWPRWHLLVFFRNK